MYMKSEFERILRQYGHDIFLQRRSGETYSSQLERHTVRYDSLSGGLVNNQVEVKEGVVSSTKRTYYFKAEALPFEGDRIYEHEPEVPSGQAIWVIDAAVPLRGVNGVIAYFVAGTTRIMPN